MAFGLSKLAGNSSNDSGFAFLNDRNVGGVGRPCDRMPGDKLSWHGLTIMRILPAVDDHGNIVPWFDPESETGLSPWVYVVPRMVRGVGNRNQKQVTFINELREEERGDYAETPYDVLFSAIRERAQDEENNNINEYGKLLKGGANSGAAVSYPGMCTLVQAAVYFKSTNRKSYRWYPPTGPNYVTMLLPKSTSKTLDSLMFPGSDPYAPGEEFGDMFKPGSDTFLAMHASHNELTTPSKDGWQVLLSSEEEDSYGPEADSDKFPRYIGHMITPGRSIPTPDEREIQSKVIPWDRLVRVLTVEEQVKQLCSAFTNDVLALGFEGSDFEHLLSPSVLRWIEARRRSKVSMHTRVEAAGREDEDVEEEVLSAPARRRPGLSSLDDEDSEQEVSRPARTARAVRREEPVNYSEEPEYSDDSDAHAEEVYAHSKRDHGEEVLETAPSVDPNAKMSALAKLRAARERMQQSGG